MENKNIRKLLIKIGVSSNFKGFHYILEATNIIKKQKIHTSMTTIYEMIHKKYGGDYAGIERAIRHAIGKAYKQNNVLKKLYSKIPDNSVFLYDLVFNFDIFLDIIKE